MRNKQCSDKNNQRRVKKGGSFEPLRTPPGYAPGQQCAQGNVLCGHLFIVIMRVIMACLFEQAKQLHHFCQATDEALLVALSIANKS